MATHSTNESGPAPRLRRWAHLLALVPLIALAACKPAKSVEYYRKNTIDRDRVVNRCLANNSNSWDCVNAITAEAERWGTKDVDGFTVVISGDAAPPTSGPTP